MIPKIIHYCWFGKKALPTSVQKNIETWKNFLPDYKIKEWNEENFDVEMMPYTSEAYFAKKYAFVSDVARLYALVTEGGLYLDTDMIFLKSLPDSFLQVPAFAGIESEDKIATSILASIPNHPIFKYFFEDYKKRQFFELLKFSRKPNTQRFKEIMLKRGFIPCNKQQYIADIQIYPQEYFCNKDYKTGRYYTTEISYAIHDFAGTWCNNPKTLYQRVLSRCKQLSIIVKYNIKSK